MIDAAYRGALADILDPSLQVEPPTAVEFSRAAGLEPDPWQARVFNSDAKRIVMLCSRQSGKSTTAGTLAMWDAAYHQRRMILMGAPRQDQASELLLKARGTMYLASPKITDLNTGMQKHNLHNAVTRMRLANHSRIVVLPGSADTVRGYSAVDLLILDEAAYIPDDFYQSVFPMLAVSGGRMILMSTPHAKQGAFYEIWANAPEWNPKLTADKQPDAWLKIKVTWRDCPRISPAIVEEYARTYGEHAMRREFECEFQDEISSLFTTEQIEGIAKADVEAWEIF